VKTSERARLDRRSKEDKYAQGTGTEEQGHNVKEMEERREKLMLIGQSKSESIILSLIPHALQ
jgi:hypothetical protein